MYLKSIDIQGFKSFPDKIKIGFDDGITAIVGPNGSGKSNICDAIRWVLGEQSTKMLRGSKMEDVIFNGTQKRKAVGFAEVGLTIDNKSGFLATQYDEVTVSRRYFRSGESEYYINGNQVRLKDINELLMDTGLGRDGYSIIGQGQIAEILSVKSEDRRQIFEEAAGITKFRFRKGESEKKLALTDENLSRIGDIVKELEDRLLPLESQSKKAMRYLELYEALKKLEISTWLSQIDEIKSGMDKLYEDVRTAGGDLERHKLLADGADRESERLYGELREKDAEIERRRGEIRDSEIRSADISAETAVLQNDIKNNLSNIERLKGQIVQSGTRDEDVLSRIAECEKEIVTASSKKQAISETLAALIKGGEEQGAGTCEIERALNEKLDEQRQVMLRMSERKVSLSAGQAQLELLKSRLEESGCELLRLKEQMEQMLTEKEELEGEARGRREEGESLSNIMSGYTGKLEIIQKRYDESVVFEASLRRDYDAKGTRLKMLVDLERDYDGFARSVKVIMAQKEQRRLSGIHGPVSRLLRVESKYALAIETALGAAAGNIVVDTEEDAKVAINYLKTSDSGRATFLPISSVNRDCVSEGEFKGLEGFVGTAAGLVEFEPKYKGIIGDLLGRTVIARDLDSAVSIARTKAFRVKVVSLDGQVVNAGGSMTGGSLGRGAGVLSRAGQIEELREEIASIEEKLNRSKTELIAQRERLELIKAEILGTKTQMDEANRSLEILCGKGENLDRIILSLTERIDTAGGDIGICEKNIKLLEESSADMCAQIEKDGVEITGLSSQIEAMEGEKRQSSEKREEILGRIMDLRLEISNIDGEITRQNESVTYFNQMLEEAKVGVRRFEDEIEEILKNNLLIEQAVLQKREIIEEIKNSAGEKSALVEELIKGRFTVEASISRLQKESGEMRKKLLDLQREYERLDSKLSNSRLSQESIVNKMWDTYELSYTAAQKYREDIESLSAAGREVTRIKNEIKSLGNINVDSIEEFRQVSERYNFMSEQKADLEKAKEGLLKLIDDMTGQMRAIFSEKFAIISDEFSKTFCELFDGGRGYLKLTEPDDVLGSGIEISVQPPGKNIRSLSLLSGGEQAFVAIAIMFAVLKVRPTPFCVFDEIEAALDDVNINKFAEYISRYKDKTQFILITHRRGTMEAADVLYGVTMQEFGVSKILCINVSEVEKSLNTV